MKITLDLPEDLVMEMKMRAVRERRKLKDVAAEVLKRGLKAPPEDATPRPRRRVKLPLITCQKDAPAARMSTEDLLALEAKLQLQEDLSRAHYSR